MACLPSRICLNGCHHPGDEAFNARRRICHCIRHTSTTRSAVQRVLTPGLVPPIARPDAARCILHFQPHAELSSLGSQSVALLLCAGIHKAGCREPGPAKASDDLLAQAIKHREKPTVSPVGRGNSLDNVHHMPGDIGLLKGKSAVLGVDAPLRCLSSIQR